jgi:hypothetical protein
VKSFTFNTLITKGLDKSRGIQKSMVMWRAEQLKSNFGKGGWELTHGNYFSDPIIEVKCF